MSAIQPHSIVEYPMPTYTKLVKGRMKVRNSETPRCISCKQPENKLLGHTEGKKKPILDPICEKCAIAWYLDLGHKTCKQCKVPVDLSKLGITSEYHYLRTAAGLGISLIAGAVKAVLFSYVANYFTAQQENVLPENSIYSTQSTISKITNTAFLTSAVTLGMIDVIAKCFKTKKTKQGYLGAGFVSVLGGIYTGFIMTTYRPDLIGPIQRGAMTAIPLLLGCSEGMKENSLVETSKLMVLGSIFFGNWIMGDRATVIIGGAAGFAGHVFHQVFLK